MRVSIISESWRSTASRAVGVGGGTVTTTPRWNRIFASLKKELYRHEDYATVAEAKSSIFEYIEVFYTRVRRQSSLGYVSQSSSNAPKTPNCVSVFRGEFQGSTPRVRTSLRNLVVYILTQQVRTEECRTRADAIRQNELRPQSTLQKLTAL